MGWTRPAPAQVVRRVLASLAALGVLLAATPAFAPPEFARPAEALRDLRPGDAARDAAATAAATAQAHRADALAHTVADALRRDARDPDAALAALQDADRADDKLAAVFAVDKTLTAALGADGPDQARVQTILEVIASPKLSAGLREAIRSQVVQTLSVYLGERSDQDYALLKEGEHLYIKRPNGERFDGLVDYLKENKLQEKLLKTVNASELVLLPFVYSTEGERALRDLRLDSHIAKGGALPEVLQGRFSNLMLAHLRALKGKTAVVVGHIEPNGGQPAFAVRDRNGATRLILVADLERIAGEVGFDLIPIGCQSAEAGAVGAIDDIKDVDALQGFRRALDLGPSPAWGAIMGAITGPHLKMSIDIAKTSIDLGDGARPRVIAPLETWTGALPPKAATPANLVVASNRESSLIGGSCSAGASPCVLSAGAIAFSARVIAATKIALVAGAAFLAAALLRRWITTGVPTDITERGWINVAVAWLLFVGLMAAAIYLPLAGDHRILGLIYAPIAALVLATLARMPVSAGVVGLFWLAGAGLQIAQHFCLYDPNLC
jgi:hypothetical protein